VIGYVIGGWSAAAGLILLYSWRTLRRGRALSRNLPAEEQTWR
jgi:hypothetical protein